MRPRGLASRLRLLRLGAGGTWLAAGALKMLNSDALASYLMQQYGIREPASLFLVPVLIAAEIAVGIGLLLPDYRLFERLRGVAVSTSIALCAAFLVEYCLVSIVGEANHHCGCFGKHIGHLETVLRPLLATGLGLAGCLIADLGVKPRHQGTCRVS